MVISFLVLRFIYFSSSLVHFKKGPDIIIIIIIIVIIIIIILVVWIFETKLLSIRVFGQLSS